MKVITVHPVSCYLPNRAMGFFQIIVAHFIGKLPYLRPQIYNSLLSGSSNHHLGSPDSIPVSI